MIHLQLFDAMNPNERPIYLCIERSQALSDVDVKKGYYGQIHHYLQKQLRVPDHDRIVISFAFCYIESLHFPSILSISGYRNGISL